MLLDEEEPVAAPGDVAVQAPAADLVAEIEKRGVSRGAYSDLAELLDRRNPWLAAAMDLRSASRG